MGCSTGVGIFRRVGLQGMYDAECVYLTENVSIRQNDAKMMQF